MGSLFQAPVSGSPFGLPFRVLTPGPRVGFPFWDPVSARPFELRFRASLVDCRVGLRFRGSVQLRANFQRRIGSCAPVLGVSERLPCRASVSVSRFGSPFRAPISGFCAGLFGRCAHHTWKVYSEVPFRVYSEVQTYLGTRKEFCRDSQLCSQDPDQKPKGHLTRPPDSPSSFCLNYRNGQNGQSSAESFHPHTDSTASSERAKHKPKRPAKAWGAGGDREASFNPSHQSPEGVLKGV